MLDVVTLLRDGSRIGCAAMGLLAGVSLWQNWSDRPALAGSVGLVSGSLGTGIVLAAHFKLETSAPYLAVLINSLGLVAASIGIVLFLCAAVKLCVHAGKGRIDSAR